MINASKVIYSGIVALILSGGGLGYYLLSGDSTALDAQNTESLNSDNPITVVDDNTHTIQQQVTETVSVKQQYEEKDIDIKFKDGRAWIKKSVKDKYPGWESFLVESEERTKKKDPVYYRYQYDNPFHKQVDLESAKEKINVLMDHTLMIVGCTGGWGTGWILDYVLPEGRQKYPTKFFIASNGHVVNGFKWDESNPYEQMLSAPEKDSKFYSNCSQKDKITLIKEKVKAHEDDDFDRSKWAQSRRRNGYQMRNVNDTYNVSKYKGESNNNRDSDYWQFTLQKPKLVYFPHNYLGTDKHPEYAADFAVFEVDFEDENVAKLFTRDFYGKYDREQGTHKEKALDFFAEPLHKKYTSQQLLEEDVQVWMVGYPGIGHSHKASANYNINRKSASRLTYEGVRGEDDRLILGLMIDTSGHWSWQGKPVKKIGYSYPFSNPEIEHGASGSLVTMGDKTVLGLFSLLSLERGIGGATPLRNMEIKNKDGKVIFQAYDFMEGAAGQKGSYKEQIQKYFLKRNQRTSLSKLRNW